MEDVSMWTYAWACRFGPGGLWFHAALPKDAGATRRSLNGSHLQLHRWISAFFWHILAAKFKRSVDGISLYNIMMDIMTLTFWTVAHTPWLDGRLDRRGRHPRHQRLPWSFATVEGPLCRWLGTVLLRSASCQLWESSGIFNSQVGCLCHPWSSGLRRAAQKKGPNDPRQKTYGQFLRFLESGMDGVLVSLPQKLPGVRNDTGHHWTLDDTAHLSGLRFGTNFARAASKYSTWKLWQPMVKLSH